MMYELELWAKLCMRILLLHMHVTKDTLGLGLAKLAFILLIFLYVVMIIQLKVWGCCGRVI